VPQWGQKLRVPLLLDRKRDGWHSKLGRRYAEPGDKWRAGGAPADGAMAIRFVERAARHLVTNPPAKASALQHRGLLYKDEWR
jgi:hypothetical protein